MKMKMNYLMKKRHTKKLKNKLNVSCMSKRSQGNKKAARRINKIENLRRGENNKVKLSTALKDKLHM